MSIPRPLAIALWPLSRVYARCVSLRKSLYAKGLLKSKRLNATVVSVGNLTVGGTGKTPMVLWLAEKFISEGKNVAILTRGYRGSGGTSDEVELLRHRLRDRVRFGVGSNRYESGRRLESEHEIDVFLLDDGFQHLQLARDLDIVMLDGSTRLRDEFVLPAGRLREPTSALTRAAPIFWWSHASLSGLTSKLGTPTSFASFIHKLVCLVFGDLNPSTNPNT